MELEGACIRPKGVAIWGLDGLNDLLHEVWQQAMRKDIAGLSGTKSHLLEYLTPWVHCLEETCQIISRLIGEVRVNCFECPQNLCLCNLVKMYKTIPHFNKATWSEKLMTNGNLGRIAVMGLAAAPSTPSSSLLPFWSAATDTDRRDCCPGTRPFLPAAMALCPAPRACFRRECLPPLLNFPFWSSMSF